MVLGTATMGYDGLVAITPVGLSPGLHNLTAVIIDRAGNPSAPSAAFTTLDNIHPGQLNAADWVIR